MIEKHSSLLKQHISLPEPAWWCIHRLRDLRDRAKLRAQDRTTLSVGGHSITATYESLAAVKSATYFDEQKQVEWLQSRLDRGDVFWDVGGHHGYFSCLLSDYVDTVVTFEPLPANRSVIKANFEANEISNGVLKPIALGAENAQKTIALPDDAELDSTASIVESGNEVSIKVRTGDAIVEEQTQIPTAVKIDVEGAERRVLAGMETILSSSTCQFVLCEVHGEAGISPEGVTHYLSNLDFTTEIMAEREPNWFVSGQK